MIESIKQFVKMADYDSVVNRIIVDETQIATIVYPTRYWMPLYSLIITSSSYVNSKDKVRPNRLREAIRFPTLLYLP